MANLLSFVWVLLILTTSGSPTVLFHSQETGSSVRSFENCKVHFNDGSTRYNCYESMCWCTRTLADCSRNYGNLRFIPRLPQSIKFLNFSHNDLDLIPKDFFANVSSITFLSLSYNYITHISDGAFDSLKRLTVLFLDHNYNMSHSTLKPVFEVKTLECVDIRHGSLKALPENLFKDHAMPNLQELFMFGNYIGLANLSMFQNLPRLRTLGWGANDVSKFLVGRLKSLEVIDLAYNRIYSFPDTCDEGSAPYFPHLRLLNLNNNHIHAIPGVVCLPRLENLVLSGNWLHTLYTDMFRSEHFPRLKYLYLEHIGTHIKHIQDYAFRNQALGKISLMYNNIQFSKEKYVSTDSFDGCPNLQTLQLSHNVFSGVSDERFLRLFGNLSKLSALYLGGTALEQITPDTFARFPHLTTLQLYLNKITEIPDGAFNRNPHLRQLQLNNNRIKTIKETTFSEGTRKGLKWLDISGNPFSCDCDLRWFSDWLRANQSIFSRSRSDYNCSNLERTRVASFRMVDQACLLARDTSKFLVASLAILILSMTFVFGLFRYRWHLRLVLYEAFRGRGDARRRRLQEGNFDYDVFVSYASEELPWVRQHLMPELEDRLGLRLCVHERDFIPGKNIVDNIADCVQSSKKILMIFSKDFARSQWCQFELTFSLSHVMNYDDDLIVVCLGDLTSREMTTAMMAVMKTTTYIGWSELPEARAAFWGMLHIALQEVVPCAE